MITGKALNLQTITALIFCMAYGHHIVLSGSCRCLATKSLDQRESSPGSLFRRKAEAELGQKPKRDDFDE